jgi:photosystem II stability/assembly factor-like uncharacterized protein
MDTWTDGGQIIVVVGQGGTIARNADGGATWCRHQSGTSNAVWGEGSVLVAVGNSGLAWPSPSAADGRNARPPVTDVCIRSTVLYGCRRMIRR